MHANRTPSTTNGGIAMRVAIFRVESDFKSDAVNVNGPTSSAPNSRDRGMVQINDYWHPEVSDEQAFDWRWSVVWSLGVPLNAWNAYTSGAYRAHADLGWLAIQLAVCQEKRAEDRTAIELLEEQIALIEKINDDLSAEVTRLEQERTTELYRRVDAETALGNAAASIDQHFALYPAE